MHQAGYGAYWRAGQAAQPTSPLPAALPPPSCRARVLPPIGSPRPPPARSPVTAEPHVWHGAPLDAQHVGIAAGAAAGHSHTAAGGLAFHGPGPRSPRHALPPVRYTSRAHPRGGGRAGSTRPLASGPRIADAVCTTPEAGAAGPHVRTLSSRVRVHQLAAHGVGSEPDAERPSWAEQPAMPSLRWADVSGCAQPPAHPRAGAAQSLAAPSAAREGPRQAGSSVPPAPAHELHELRTACAFGAAGAAHAAPVTMPHAMLAPTGTSTVADIIDEPNALTSGANATNLAFVKRRPPKGWAPGVHTSTEHDDETARKARRREVRDVELEIAAEIRRGAAPVRWAALELATSSAFRRVVLLLIVISSAALALESPYAWWALRHPHVLRAVRNPYINLAVSTMFTLEFVVRFYAFRGAYFRVAVHDGVAERAQLQWWNILDLCVVLVSWADVALSLELSAGVTASTSTLLVLRLARVSRPLRTLSFLPGCKTIVETIAQSVSQLSEALKLLLFGIVFFALLGTQLFHGDLRNRCVGAGGAVADDEQLCTVPGNPLAFAGQRCAAGSACAPVGDNPDGGVTSFDHVALASISVFHSVGGAGFSDIMFRLIAANGTPGVVIFFFVVVVVGSLFVLNIFVSVLEQSYNEEVEAKKEREAAKREADAARRAERRQYRRAVRDAKARGLPPPEEPESLRQPAAGAQAHGGVGLHGPNQVDLFFTQLGRALGAVLCCRLCCPKREQPAAPRRRTRVAPSPHSPGSPAQAAPSTPAKRAPLSQGWAEHRDADGTPYYHHAPSKVTEWEPWEERHLEPDGGGGSGERVAYVNVLSGEMRDTRPRDMNVVPVRFVAKLLRAIDEDPQSAAAGSHPRDGPPHSAASKASARSTGRDQHLPFARRVSARWAASGTTSGFVRSLCRLVADHPLFDLGVNLSIVGSCVVAAMAVDPFIEPRSAATLQTFDLAFTGVFLLELLLMVVGHTWRRYWRNPFHRFDFVLVVLSVAENFSQMIVEAITRSTGGTVSASVGSLLLFFSGLKAFRAVRIVRIAYELELRSVQELGNKFPAVISAVGAIFLVLLIVVFVFAIVLMVGFGGLFAGPDGVPTERQHYDDIGWAMVSVMQIILTADGYYEAHEALSARPAASEWERVGRVVGIFFIFAFVIISAAMILVTLVTAVLVSSFNPEEDAPEEDDAPEEEGGQAEHTGAGEHAGAGAGAGADVARGLRGVDAESSSDDESEDEPGRTSRARRSAASTADSSAGRPGTAAKAVQYGSRREALHAYLYDCAPGVVGRLCGPPATQRFAERERRQAEAKAELESEFEQILNGAAEHSMNHWDILELQADFVRHDENGDSKLSVDEALVLLADLGYEVDKSKELRATLLRYISEIDDEGDQQLEFSEFVQLMVRCRELRPRAGLRTGANRPSASKVRKPRFVRQHHRPPYPSDDVSRLYKLCHAIVYDSRYEWLNTALIFLSTVTLALEYTWVGRAYRLELRLATAVFTVFFAMDVLITAYVKNVVEYLLTPAHVMDVAVVAVSAASLFAAQYPALRSLRALRVLRIFQLLSEFREMRLLLECLSASVQGTFTVCFFLAIFMFLFAILGVAIFGGAMSKCVDADQETMYSRQLLECTAETCREVCAAQGGTWFTPLPNFDSTTEGMWALFVITTLEGWQDVLYAAVDSRGLGLQPVQRERLGWSWRQEFSIVYFFIFIVINVVLMTNLFVGVVCSEFNMKKKRLEHLTNLSKQQREWVMAQELLAKAIPPRIPREPRADAHPIRKWAFRIFYHGPSAPAEDAMGSDTGAGVRKPRGLNAGSAAFKTSMGVMPTPAGAGARAKAATSNAAGAEPPPPPPPLERSDIAQYVALGTFGLNVLSLCCVLAEHHGMSARYELYLDLCQLGLSCVLLLDIGAKVLAVGLRLYLSVSHWHKLELFLEVVTPVYCAFRVCAYAGVPLFAGNEFRLLGACRSLRMFRLLAVRWLHTVGAIAAALLASLPSVANLVVLLFFWVVAFDFVGVSLFGGAQIGDWYPDGEGLSDELNFRGLSSGLVTLCVLLRFEGWTALWADLLVATHEGRFRVQPPPVWTVYAFFLVYLVTAVYMMLSVFIALLLDTLESLNAAAANRVDPRALAHLVHRWSELDPEADQMMSPVHLGVLLRVLGPPFVERSEVSTVLRLMELLMHLDLPVYLLEPGSVHSRLILPERGAEVTYIEVAHALVKRAVWAGQEGACDLDPQLNRIVMAKLPKAYPIVRELPNQRTFTREVAIARAIAQAAFDPAQRVLAANLDPHGDDESDDGFNLFEHDDEDDDLGLRHRADDDGELRYIAV